MKRLNLLTLILFFCLIPIALLKAEAVEDNFAHIGKGHTTAYYIDKDGDGYGVGKRSSGDYSDIFAKGDMPDADDNDAEVHTGEQAIQKWGNMKNFLIHLGYNPNHIYYVSLNGNDSTGVPDEPSHPYAVPTFGCNASYSTGVGKILVPGDVVIYRAGEYSSIAANSLRGASGNPIIFMAYPGEQVLLTNPNGGIFTGSGSCNLPSEHLTFDGFIDGPNEYIAGNSNGIRSGCAGCANYITARNIEFRNMFWGAAWANHYFTLENNVFHGNHEHSIYISPHDDYPELEGIVIRDNIFGVHTAVSGYGNVHNNGHARGTIYEGNIIHGSCGTGLDFQSGSGKDAIIRNNLIFNNGKTAIQISNSGGGQLYDQTNMTIVNNTLYSPQISRSVAPCWNDCNYPAYANDYGSITLSSETDSNGINFAIRDIKVMNNILYMGKREPIYIVGNDYLNTLNTLTFKNNIIFHRDPNSQDKVAIACSLWHCQEQNGSVNLRFNLGQLETAYTEAKNNLIADPLFKDASSSYYSNPEKMNFDLTSASPAIDFGITTFYPAVDLRGNSRNDGFPDAGCYEYTGEEPAILYGDVSGNGEISAADASLAAQYAVGLITLTPEQITKADVSGNDEVSAADASLIARRAVGLISKFPVEE